MEAIERFFNATGSASPRNESVAHTDMVMAEVGNPMLVVIVGSLGLLSNIVGLFLFHGSLSLVIYEFR